MLAPRLHGTKVRVEFGEAMRADGASDISEDILEEARRLIARSG
jgi:hypothetical protein